MSSRQREAATSYIKCLTASPGAGTIRGMQLFTGNKSSTAFRVCDCCQQPRHPVSFSRSLGPFAGWCEICAADLLKPCRGCGAPIERKGRMRYCSIPCQIKASCTGTEDPDGCWTWNGAVRDNGYGVVRVRLPSGRLTLRSPARAMFAATYGEVPNAFSVLQRCGTKNCCQPKHLRLAVQQLELVAQDRLPGPSALRSATC